jgi:hypothetical protein
MTNILPLYRSHKQVRAVKIKSIERPAPPAFLRPVCRGSAAFGSACGLCERCRWTREIMTAGARIVPDDTDCAPFTVGLGYLTKHNPEPGGYYVLYADGYESFSPAAAFEEGYTRVF